MTEKDYSIKKIDTSGAYILVTLSHPKRDDITFKFVKEGSEKPTQKYIDECGFLALNEAKANF